MTPLALKIAKDLTLPIKHRTFHEGDIISLFSKEMHCFEVSAIAKSINEAIRHSDNEGKAAGTKANGEANDRGIMDDVASMLPGLFLPSPVTWLEWVFDNKRMAFVLEKVGKAFKIYVLGNEGSKTFGAYYGTFEPCTILESSSRMKIHLNEDWKYKKPVKEDSLVGSLSSHKHAETMKMIEDITDLSTIKDNQHHKIKMDDLESARAHANIRLFETQSEIEAMERSVAIQRAAMLPFEVIAFATLAIDLINTPGIIGMKSHAPHAAIARSFAKAGIGKYPLRAWSEVTVKTHTVHSKDELETGITSKKCLHFVRAHRRKLKGGESIVRAHWRGDPALGIKRTRYKVEA